MSDNTELRAHLIDLFRKSIEERYQFEDMQNRFELNEVFDEALATEVREFFLENIYPPLKEREKIERSMNNIGKYLKDPSKLKLLVGNMTRAIFTFGRHLPMAIQAAYNSFETFNSAMQLEKQLLAQSKKNEFEMPLIDEEFNTCILGIDQSQIEKFMTKVMALFEAITNKKLIDKTIGMLTQLAEKMEQLPEHFPKEDVEALYFGKSILEQGDAIFDRYDEQTNKELIATIQKNEDWYLTQIYS